MSACLNFERLSVLSAESSFKSLLKSSFLDSSTLSNKDDCRRNCIESRGSDRHGEIDRI